MNEGLKRAAKARLPIPPPPKPRKNYDRHPTGADLVYDEKTNHWRDRKGNLIGRAPTEDSHIIPLPKKPTGGRR